MSNVVLADLAGRPCPIAAALELVGERWALLVVREIALGSCRFGDIVAGTGAPRDRIAARLKALENVGVIARVPALGHHEYRLTASGRDLMPVLDALLTWGRAHAVSPDDPDREPRYPTLSDRVKTRENQEMQ
jgi:DNA-binding HxlR family transcriptional regulator